MNIDESVYQNEEAIFPVILEMIPSFIDRWKEHSKYWNSEPAGIYNDISEFTHFVVDSYYEGNISWYPDFFGLIENMIASGNEKIQELAIVGFLEDIQVISSWKQHKGKIYRRWLGPNSKRAWREIDRLYSKHGSLVNIIRSEEKSINLENKPSIWNRMKGKFHL